VSAIATLDRPTPAQLDRCIAEHRPVILRGLMEDQAATRSWDLGYLRACLGERPVKVVEQADPRLFWDPAKGLPIQTVPFTAFASRFDRDAAGFAYLQDDVNSFPHLKDDYRLPPMMESKQMLRAKFWLSGRGLITPLHYDPVETFHWMVRGTKRFVCYRPGVGRYYPFPARSTAPFISRVDPDRPEPARFPRFGACRPLTFDLQAGEILYLPAYWWHQVYSEGAVNISVNFVWSVSPWRSARHLGQYLRARRHLVRQTAAARALAVRADQSARRAPTT
jgi:lysine-specific demethylase 8/jumonji domain-containing protein 7